MDLQIGKLPTRSVELAGVRILYIRHENCHVSCEQKLDYRKAPCFLKFVRRNFEFLYTALAFRKTAKLEDIQ